MLSVFEASLSFEQEDTLLASKKQDVGGNDNWQSQRKVKILKPFAFEDEELGDSCCFGTRTVEFGVDCIWKLHGGV